MPKFADVADAKRIILAAWNAFNPNGQVPSSIGNTPVTVTWHYRSGTMDAGAQGDWEFTGDQVALTDWWTSFGVDYHVLPAQLKPGGNYQINVQYTPGAPATWFNFHLTVPKP